MPVPATDVNIGLRAFPRSHSEFHVPVLLNVERGTRNAERGTRERERGPTLCLEKKPPRTIDAMVGVVWPAKQ